ncbi:MAG TPA: methyltransferase domain-containing protein [Chloroflexota bacterium]
MSQTPADHAAWTDVDTSDDPAFFIRFLDASRARIVATAASDPAAFFAYLDVHSGQRVLDAACGVGELTRLLGRLVAPDGEAVGVDYSTTMVDEASRRAEQGDVPVRFEQGDIMALDFPDNSFDRARAEQVLQHIPRPDTALAELTRVTRPGGLVAVMEPDWDTLVIDADNLGMSRAFTVYNSTVVVPRGHIGRQLPALFRDAGLVDVGCTATVLLPPYPVLREFIESNTRTAVVEGFVMEREATTWLRDLESRNAGGRFFAAFSYFRVVGRVATNTTS